MKDFIISTDSTADLPKTYVEENNIILHPLHYIVADVEYGTDIEELLPKDFYQSMRAGKMPTTSASNPEYISKLMRKQVSSGHDVLHISFSSGLSSSYNNAAVCAKEIMEEIPDANIIVIDSLAASGQQALMVDMAVQLKKQGKTIKEIADWIEGNKENFVLQFIVEDLFHLVRGGRLSKSSAFVGSALHIQPLLHIDEMGKLGNIGKIRGRKKALMTMADNIKEKTNGLELNKVFITHADSLDDATYLAGKIKEMYGIEDIMISDLSPTLGAHGGAGTVLAAYYANER